MGNKRTEETEEPSLVRACLYCSLSCTFLAGLGAGGSVYLDCSDKDFLSFGILFCAVSHYKCVRAGPLFLSFVLVEGSDNLNLSLSQIFDSSWC